MNYQLIAWHLKEEVENNDYTMYSREVTVLVSQLVNTNTIINKCNVHVLMELERNEIQIKSGRY